MGNQQLLSSSFESQTLLAWGNFVLCSSFTAFELGVTLVRYPQLFLADILAF